MRSGFVHSLETLESRRLLAADLLADVSGIYPTDSVQLEGISYFAADDGVHGRELWKSNGTVGGTELAGDLVTGAEGSNPTNLVLVNDTIVFTTVDGIYSTDGTTVTKLVDLDDYSQAWAAVVNGQALIVVAMEDGARDLWSSDGSAVGTQLVTNLYTQAEGRSPILNSDLFHDGAILRVMGDRLFYIDYNGRLFSTDGTSQGTVELGTNENDHQYARSIVILDDEAYFLTTVYDIQSVPGGEQVTSDGNFQLWKTDGTVQGTEQIDDIPETGAGKLQTASGKVYFATLNDQGCPSLWVTDGTGIGTHVVKEFTVEGMIRGMQERADGKLLFALQANSSSEDSTLWVSDGTEAGTTQLMKLGSGELVVSDEVASVNGVNYVLYTSLVAPPGSIRKEMTGRLLQINSTLSSTSLMSSYADGGRNVDYTLDVVDGKVALTTPEQTYVVNSAMSAPAGPNQGTTTLSDRVLRIFGTKNNDAIRIYRMSNNPDRFVVNLNGQKRSFAFADVRKIVVYGYSGNDNIAFSEVNGVVAIRSMIQAGSGNDTIFGGSTRDSVWGGEGNDFIHTSVANDEAYGGLGDDTILGMAGADTLDGEEGADSVIGGSQQDVISGGFDDSNDTLDGGESADVIFGSAVSEIFFGGEQGGDPLDDVLLA